MVSRGLSGILNGDWESPDTDGTVAVLSEVLVRVLAHLRGLQRDN